MLGSPLRRTCSSRCIQTQQNTRGTRVKKLCAEQWFDSRNCQMASLLHYTWSPGGLHEHLFLLFRCHHKHIELSQLHPFDRIVHSFREQCRTDNCIVGGEMNGNALLSVLSELCDSVGFAVTFQITSQKTSTNETKGYIFCFCFGGAQWFM